MSDHVIVKDRAGFGGHERLTCKGSQCNNATLVRQPFMSGDRWRYELVRFYNAHPQDVPDEERARLMAQTMVHISRGSYVEWLRTLPPGPERSWVKHVALYHMYGGQAQPIRRPLAKASTTRWPWA